MNATPSSIRWLALVPGLFHRLEPFTDKSGEVLEWTAPNKTAAIQRARELGVPPAAIITSRLIYESAFRRSRR